jgi:predicted lipoprotein with Yx(FWY)xxD motif/plastocyanin
MPPNANRTDTDVSTNEHAVFERRPLLKALWAGAAFSLGSGVAAASGEESGDGTGYDDDDEQDDRETDSNGIHPTFGLPLAADEEVPADIEPAEVVELHVLEEENVHDGFPVVPDPEDPEQVVEQEEFMFDPVGLRLSPGDIVHYENIAHLHTVTAFHEKFGEEMFPLPTRIPDGVPGFTSPIIVGEEGWLYEFTETGVYDILCLPHLTFGMVQRVVVTDEDDAEDLEGPLEPSETVPPNAQSVLAAPEMAAQQIVENETVAWEDLTLESAMPSEPMEPGEEAATVQVREHPSHGDILVDQDGMTLYVFEQDTQGAGESSCQGDCADAWPPFTAEGEPTVGDGVTADLATFERETGETQVMANGWPLYYFAQDEAAGDARGYGVNDVWWVVGPDGSPVRSGSDE